MKQLDVFWGLVWRASHRIMRRGKPMRRPLIAGILILGLIAQFGCASLPVLSPRPGEAVLKVAVTSGRFAPTFEVVDGPAKGALRGAGRGLVRGFLVAFATAGIFAPEILLGPIRGAMTAEPAFKVEKREAAAREIVTAQKIQENLRDRVVAIGRAQTPHTFIALADRGPSVIGERSDYRPLSQEGIEMVLEVVAESVQLHGDMVSLDSPLNMYMSVNRRLVRIVDNAEIYAESHLYFRYRKSGRWGSLAEFVDNPESFRGELNQAYADIAERIVKKVFLGMKSN